MGCDIHFYVEKYTSDAPSDGPLNISEERDIKISETLGKPKDSRWITADSWELIDDHDGGWWSVTFPFYRGRNYDLFAKLADVRSDESDVPICDPRGTPDDASSAYLHVSNTMEGDGDGHSHSYFTLEELLDNDFSNFPDFEETIEKMKLIDNDASNVRCVFFFDN